MKYQGSKNRHARYLLPIILENKKPQQYYVEPFVGDCNIIDKVYGLRIGNDNNFYLIEMWKALQGGWCPPKNISEDEYRNCKYNFDKKLDNEEFNAEIGFVGIGCSYSGKMFGGYARGKDNYGNDRNYCYESYKNVINQKYDILGIDFYSVDYKDLQIPDNSIIYCDPPYANTTKYKTGDFNSSEFWEWCELKVREGHKVFVSEYTAPDDWKCVWEKEVNSSLTKQTGSKKATEKLFVKTIN